MKGNHTISALVWFALWAAACLVTPANAADDLHVVVTVNAGQTTFAFEEKLDQEVTFVMLNPALTLLLGDFYLSASLAASIANEDISEEEETGEASHQEFDLTLGYRLSERWTLFGGYHRGETEIEFKARDAEDLPNPPPPFTDTITVSGPYLGGSWSRPSESAGTVTLSLAYAPFDFEGDFNSNLDPDPEDEVEFDDETGKVSGPSNGFGFTARWSIPLGSDWYYAAQLKYNLYRQNATFADSGNSYDIEESVTFFAMGLSWLLR